MSKVFVGTFLDGKTAAKLPVTLAADGSGLLLQWARDQRRVQADAVIPIYPRQRGVQFVHLADGSTCEMGASQELLAELAQAGVSVQKESAMAAVLYGDWRIAAMALSFLAGVIAAFYVWLLPTVAEAAANLVPFEIQRKIGETALRQVEAKWFSPSQLPTAQQGEIQERFEALKLQLSGPQFTGLELMIRKSSEGPNAFALPGNFIVLTDELVTLMDGDLDAISGVLAHELGHLKHRHGLRSVVQATALTVLGSALIGDYSGALAVVPAGLGHLKYSRNFESAADAYEFEVLCTEHIDLAKTALFFDRLSKMKNNVGNLIPSYLSSHPGAEDRATYFRRACPTRTSGAIRIDRSADTSE